MKTDTPDQTTSDRIFATLTPANGLAIQYFEALQNVLSSQPQRRAHHSQFVRLYQQRLDADHRASLSPFNSSDSDSNATTEADLTQEENVEVDNSGCYVLSFESLPSSAKDGWMVGTGRFDIDDMHGKVDLLLVPPFLDHTHDDYASRTPPYPRHLAFRYDPWGRLLLKVRHNGVSLDGESLHKNDSRVLSSRARIEILGLRFDFKFIDMSKDQELVHRVAHREFLSKHLGFNPPPETTSVTPSQNDVRIGPSGEWLLHGIVGASSTSVVQAASNVRTREAVAVKRIVRWPTSTSSTAVDYELDVYENMRPDILTHKYGRFVMRRHSIIQGRISTGRVQEVFLLWEPLARADFSSFRLSASFHDIDESIKLQFFSQALLGLQALHDIGWIHRDLKPHNIAIVSYEPPHAVLIDLGTARKTKTRGHSPEAGTCGTIGYLAPELENATFASHYGQKVDVWSMGAVGVFMIDLGRIPWLSRENIFLPVNGTTSSAFSNFTNYLDSLSSAEPSTFRALLYQMLRLRPRDRLAVQNALEHPSLSTSVAAANLWLTEQIASGSKRRRE